MYKLVLITAHHCHCSGPWRSLAKNPSTCQSLISKQPHELVATLEGSNDRVVRSLLWQHGTVPQHAHTDGHGLSCANPRRTCMNASRHALSATTPPGRQVGPQRLLARTPTPNWMKPKGVQQVTGVYTTR